LNAAETTVRDGAELFGCVAPQPASTTAVSNAAIQYFTDEQIAIRLGGRGDGLGGGKPGRAGGGSFVPGSSP
jgi:hypothetical protein